LKRGLSTCAAGAGAEVAEFVEGVDTGPVAVAPLDGDGVISYERDLERMDIWTNGFCVDPSFSRHFIQATGAGTGQTEFAGRIKTFMSIFPLDQNIMDVGAGNFRRNQRIFGCHLEGNFDIRFRFTFDLNLLSEIL